ncbi:hypothetical protein [Thermomonospora cellulosilytica]|uniref:Uncharacterized protein n=1 Tax=Thermomonospora cellulosilytica TaxID=1411118 RepID=A0A7W3R729_9ACTN|nr:hypothetical protein [Thermomonospora cellulosilytica]MBA9002833.1 hypothetical protein [Thermomonospora cellulosilytica]
MRRRPTITGDPEPAGRCSSCVREIDVTTVRAPDLRTLAWMLGHPTGVGVTGVDAEGFLRAVFVELLGNGSDRTRVVIGRDELNRLFGDRVGELPWETLLPRLQVCELLEDAIEYLETDIWMAGAEKANTDLVPEAAARSTSRTYWFATPGEDSDVVFQTLQRAEGYNLAGLMFGAWPHGPTIPTTTGVTETRPLSPLAGLPLMTVSEAITRLAGHGPTGSAEERHAG